MKVCYIFTSAGLISDSVQNKVISQIRYLNYTGILCRGAFFTTEIKEITKLNSEIDLIPIDNPNWRYFSKIQLQKILCKKIDEYLSNNNFQIVYFRYPGSNYWLYKLVKKFSGKIIFEFQSKVNEEIKLYKKENKLNFTPSSFLSYIQYYFYPLFCEYFYLHKILRNTKKLVGVTEEIVKFYNRNRKENSKVLALGNAIDYANFDVRTISDLSNVVTLIFLKGASNLAPWYGIDRLIKGICNYNGEFRIELLIIGNMINEEKEAHEFIKYIPHKSAAELIPYFNNSHIAIGSLGLNRINLKEASVLKVREYFARGIPFIYAYDDIDIVDNSDASEFCLKFPNDESDIDIQRVIEFTLLQYRNLNHPTQMRRIAEEQLSYKIKMERLSHFLKL